MRVNYKTSENHVTILELKKLEIFTTEYGRLKNLSVIKSVKTVEAAYSISSQGQVKVIAEEVLPWDKNKTITTSAVS